MRPRPDGKLDHRSIHLSSYMHTSADTPFHPKVPSLRQSTPCLVMRVLMVFFTEHRWHHLLSLPKTQFGPRERTPNFQTGRCTHSLSVIGADTSSASYDTC